MNFLADIVGRIFKELFSELIGGFLQARKEDQINANLKKLGYEEGQVDRMTAERKVAMRAKEIDAKPTPSNIRDTTKRL